MKTDYTKSMSHVMHSAPEFAGLRKVFQGINSTTKGSIEKSKRRHNAKQLALNKQK